MKDSLKNLVLTLGKFTHMNQYDFDIVLQGPNHETVTMSWCEDDGDLYELHLHYSKQAPGEDSIDGCCSFTKREVKTGKLGTGDFEFTVYVKNRSVLWTPEDIVGYIKVDSESKCWTLAPDALEKFRKIAKRKYVYYQQIKEYAETLD